MSAAVVGLADAVVALEAGGARGIAGGGPARAARFHLVVGLAGAVVALLAAGADGVARPLAGVLRVSLADAVVALLAGAAGGGTGVWTGRKEPCEPQAGNSTVLDCCDFTGKIA